MSLEVICHTQEDQRRLAREGVVPEYLPAHIKRRIENIPWMNKGGFEVFIPPRSKKWARENKHFPVYYV